MTDDSAATPSVAELAEALVKGDVLLVCQEHGEAAPAWGYLNLLAHADYSSLQQVKRFNEHRQPLSDWGAVVLGLITDILGRVRTDAELLETQREHLVPLELAVWGGRPLGTCDDLDAMVRGALRLPYVWRDL